MVVLLDYQCVNSIFMNCIIIQRIQATQGITGLISIPALIHFFLWHLDVGLSQIVGEDVFNVGMLIPHLAT